MSRISGYLFGLFAVVVWGVTFTTTKQLLRVFPSTEILFLRFLLGYAALWALAPRRMPWQGWRGEALLSLAGATGIAFYFLFENMALRHAGAGMVSVVVCTSPLLTALMVQCLGRTRLSRGYWLGFALAFGGVALTVSRGDLASLRGAALGAGLAAAGAVTWAVYTLVSQRLRPVVGALALLRRIFFWGLLWMLPFCLPVVDTWGFVPLRDFTTCWQLLFLGLVASAFCYVAWQIAVTRLGGIRATLLLYLNPVVGVMTAALILNEPFTLPILIGVALTFCGLTLSTLASKRAAS